MIQISKLHKVYKNFELDKVTFTLETGKIVGLIGANGAGKSTIIRILMGLEKKDSGEIIVDGQNVSNVGEKLRVGFVSQNLEIYLEQSMSEVYKFVKDIYKDVWDDKVYNYYLVDIFGLKNDFKIKELSTGMRVKFFIALELAKNPECLLLDEVTSGLDPMIRDEVLEIILELTKKNNLPILLSSHITEDLEKIANSIVYIDSGRILLDDTVENIRNRYYKVKVEELEDVSSKAKDVITKQGVKQHQYYVYDVNILGKEKKIGTVALLSDVLFCLRKENK